MDKCTQQDLRTAFNPLHGRVLRRSVETYNVGRDRSHNIGRAIIWMGISAPNRLSPTMERRKRRSAGADCYTMRGVKAPLVSLELDRIVSSAHTGSSTAMKGSLPGVDRRTPAQRAAAQES